METMSARTKRPDRHPAMKNNDLMKADNNSEV